MFGNNQIHVKNESIKAKPGGDGRFGSGRRRSSLLISLLCLSAFVLAWLPLRPVSAENAQGGPKVPQPASVQTAAETAAKNEIVYASLNFDGSAKAVYVVNQFEPTAASEVIDFGDYSKVVPISGKPDSLSLQGDQITVRTNPGRVWYQGYLKSNELPWLIKLAYTIDGKPVDAERLSGADGRLEIECTIKSNPRVDDVFRQHYVLQLSFPFDSARCGEVQAADAVVAVAGNDILVNYMILPNSPEKTLRIAADVRDFAMKPIQISAVALKFDLKMPDVAEWTDSLKQLEDGIRKLHEGSKELADGGSALNDGADKLKSGSEDIAKGAAELGSGISGLNDGMKQLDSGLVQYVDGVSRAHGGSVELSEGISALGQGMQTLSDSGTSLKEGSSQIDSGLRQIVEQLKAAGETEDPEQGGLAALLGSSAEINTALQGISGGLRTLHTQLTELKAGLGQMSDGLGEIVTQLENIPFDQLEQFTANLQFPEIPALPEVPQMTEAEWQAFWLNKLGINPTDMIANAPAQTLLGALAAQSKAAADQSLGMQELFGQLAALKQQSEQMVPLLGQLAGLKDLKDGLVQIKSQLDGIVASLNLGTAENPGEKTLLTLVLGSEQLAADYQQFDSGLKTLADGLAAQQEGMSELSTGLGRIQTNYETFHQGLSDYTAGVAQAAAGVDRDDPGNPGLLQGAQQLTRGLGTLAEEGRQVTEGSGKMADGLDKTAEGYRQFTDGLSEYQGGVSEFDDGIRKYTDGVGKLADGTLDLNRETDGMSEEARKKFDQELAKYRFEDFEPVSFVSRQNKQIKSVQFVLLTDEIPVRKAVPPPIEDQADKSFFTRLLDLFR